MAVTFDPTQSQQYGASRDAAILDLASRFHYVQAEDVADLLRCRVKVARQRLLVLHRRGKLQRFALGRNEPFIYGVRRSQKAYHSLMVLRCYRALVQQLPAGWRVTAYDVEHELWAEDKKQVIADALIVLDNELASRRRVVFLEVNLDTRRFEKPANYNALYESRAYRKMWWHQQGIEVVIAVATIRPDYVRRLVEKDSRPEITWVVASVTDLPALWKGVFGASHRRSSADS